ncbi:MAG: 3-hydroxyacyl-CoA dehydrogenase NAD-binding domain-containing protein [Thermaurantimonas sp.]
MKDSIISVAGAGTMGSSIAQLAAQNRHMVRLYDIEEASLQKAHESILASLTKLSQKGKLENQSPEEVFQRICFTTSLSDLSDSHLFIEAIVEDFEIKKKLFEAIEECVHPDCILCTNTSSLSVSKLSRVLGRPEKFAGLHFFNPATIMKLVEVVPGMNTSERVLSQLIDLMKEWGKRAVRVKDTPGFIVNRVARPFYGEALRIVEEQIATPSEVDFIMKTKGGFRMGPFELMDFIGLDVNFAVSYSVFEQMYFDPRYRPSILQQRMMESGRLGRKVGIGFYDYSSTAPMLLDSAPDEELCDRVFMRIMAMLINEAVDAVYLNIADAAAVDEAMKYGANYPKGLIEWGRDIGFDRVKAVLDRLFDHYKDMRYRASAGFYESDRILQQV